MLCADLIWKQIQSNNNNNAILGLGVMLWPSYIEANIATSTLKIASTVFQIEPVFALDLLSRVVVLLFSSALTSNLLKRDQLTNYAPFAQSPRVLQQAYSYTCPTKNGRASAVERQIEREKERLRERESARSRRLSRSAGCAPHLWRSLTELGTHKKLKAFIFR